MQKKKQLCQFTLKPVGEFQGLGRGAWEGVLSEGLEPSPLLPILSSLFVSSRRGLHLTWDYVVANMSLGFTKMLSSGLHCLLLKTSFSLINSLGYLS